MDRSRFVVILAVGVLATACGGSSHSSSSASSSAIDATAAGTATTQGGAASTTAAASGTSSHASSTAVSSGASSSGSSATSTAPTPTVAGTPNKPGSGAALPAAPGTYRYHQSGSVTFGSTTKPVPPEGTLKVDPVRPDGNQVGHRTVDPSAPPSDNTYAFRGGGVFLVQSVMRSNAGGQEQTFTCNFSPAVPIPPWPPKVGGTFKGHGDCGSFTVDLNGKVDGTKDVALGGATHHLFVLDVALVLHGQIEGSGNEVDWADPATSLVLHQEANQTGTYAGIVSFTTKSVSDLESTRPS